MDHISDRKHSLGLARLVAFIHLSVPTKSRISVTSATWAQSGTCSGVPKGDTARVAHTSVVRAPNQQTQLAKKWVAYLREAVSNKEKEGYLLCLVNLLRLVCCMTNEAGLESVLSAALSLKHETDMKKTFSSLKEAQDKAKQMRLTPEEAAKCIRETPQGRFAFYDHARGEPVRPDDYRAPDFRPWSK